FNVRLRRLPNSEMDAKIVLRDVAAAAADFVHLPVTGRRAINPRPDTRTIRFHPDGLHLHPVRLHRLMAAKKLWHIVDAVDEHIDIAIIIEVSERAAAARDFFQDPRSAFHGNVREFAVSQIPVQHLALAVSRFGIRVAHFGEYMAVAEEKVRPAVVIEIEEAGAPPEKTRIPAEPSLEGLIVENHLAQIA